MARGPKPHPTPSPASKGRAKAARKAGGVFYAGIRMTGSKRAALAALAEFPSGTSALTLGPLNGGTLSALSMMGLADRERRGTGEAACWWYVINDAGRDVLGEGSK